MEGEGSGGGQWRAYAPPCELPEAAASKDVSAAQSRSRITCETTLSLSAHTISLFNLSFSLCPLFLSLFSHSFSLLTLSLSAHSHFPHSFSLCPILLSLCPLCTHPESLLCFDVEFLFAHSVLGKCLRCHIAADRLAVAAQLEQVS